MRKLSHSEISENRSTIESIETVRKLPVVVVLDSIRSSYNVGSIFRTSDGAMIEKLIPTGYTPHPPKKDVLKTSLGSQDSVVWEFFKDPVEPIKHYKKLGYKICALEQTTKSLPHYSLDKNYFPMCLIIGNEITGVKQVLIDLCDFSIEIPQYGIKQSLNVAVAYGISIFELRRVFDKKLKQE
ncbi:MAG: RNA methyltransferase [Melioribacteraceae bacterium]|jgi:tRNA G18 (ribose-2'-O)-methylase SpoU|nr:RNA methyltransferase [Melioribacteraceae bacterium]RJP62423.1 MAG: TrmH family RNA methyltransferase [Ignavibacteriales bacterium]WKZ70390.1 MAG: RNA methyltransferase [Melioribacteraceae bacterium]